MPPAVRGYVMIHELMHLRRMDHSAKFWQLVAAACPDYEAARAWLARYEEGLGRVRAVDWEAEARRFPGGPGTYVLVLKTEAPGPVLVGRTGRIGRVVALPGYYAYIGSACGPGELAGRLKHHLKLARGLRLKWQVDFLRLRCSMASLVPAKPRSISKPLPT